MGKKKTREETLEMLKMAEMEEGRTGLVDAFIAEEETKKPKKEDKKK